MCATVDSQCLEYLGYITLTVFQKIIRNDYLFVVNVTNNYYAGKRKYFQHNIIVRKQLKKRKETNDTQTTDNYMNNNINITTQEKTSCVHYCVEIKIV